MLIRQFDLGLTYWSLVLGLYHTLIYILSSKFQSLRADFNYQLFTDCYRKCHIKHSSAKPVGMYTRDPLIQSVKM